MAVVVKLWLDHKQLPLNPTTITFNYDYVLEFFDLITQREELSKIMLGQLMSKQPKLGDHQAKRCKGIPNPNNNELIIMPIRDSPPVPKVVTNTFDILYWQSFVEEEDNGEEDFADVDQRSMLINILQTYYTNLLYRYMNEL